MAAARRLPAGPPVVRLHPLAGLLVLLVAVLSPLLSSAASANAARPVGRTTATTSASSASSASSALTTAPGSSAGQHDRRGLRTAVHRAGPSAGRRPVEGSVEGPGEARTVHAQRAGPSHLPSTPGTCSADPTGPPSTYDVALFSSRDRHVGGRQLRAAADRAPPISCGS